jgi:hypothetical protein
MKYKSIVSTISFLLISMFYVASASAGPTYLNVEVPKACGFWKVVRHKHCSVRGGADGLGGQVRFKCVGRGNRMGTAEVQTKNCGHIAFITAVKERSPHRGDGELHRVRVAHGDAAPLPFSVAAFGWRNNSTHTWQLCFGYNNACSKGEGSTGVLLI